MHQTKLLAMCIVLCVGAIAHAANLRVKNTGGVATGTCSSWSTGTACTLQYALDHAVSGDQIWVQQGTYNRASLGPVMIPNGVKVYGGFAGTEFNASQSNPVTRPTTIDGGNATECLWSEYNTPSTVLRGFTLQNGYSAGIDSGTHSKGGGGVHLFNSSIKISRCIVKNNNAYFAGGGVSVEGTSTAAHLVNCEIRDNGHASGDPVLGGGGVVVHSGAPTFTNCLIFNNRAWQGGGVNIAGSEDIPSLPRPVFINCTITKNTAVYPSPGVLDTYGTGTFRNSIIWGNSVDGLSDLVAEWASTTLTWTDVSGFEFWPGDGNIHVDPLFINPLANNFRIRYASASRNSASNDLVAADVADLDWDGNTIEKVPYDLALQSRLVENRVDMGAFETSCAASTVDCNANSIPDGCDIAEGTSLDCNVNGIPDSCDIAANPLLDCYDGNGVPDTCPAGFPGIPDGACCISNACYGPYTSCRCAALGGAWYASQKCIHVNCGGGGID